MSARAASWPSSSFTQPRQPPSRRRTSWDAVTKSASMRWPAKRCERCSRNPCCQAWSCSARAMNRSCRPARRWAGQRRRSISACSRSRARARWRGDTPTRSPSWPRSIAAVSYAEKIVAGPASRGAVDLDDSIADNLRRIAFARDARVQDLTVAVLDRPRHLELIAEVAAAGARIMTLEEGDIAGAVMAAMPGTGVDAAIGIGGLHATLVAACAVRCLGGAMQARLWPRNDEERSLLGESASRVYGVADLVPASEVAVAITGITGGQLLPGVVFGSGYAESSSLLMSSRQATIRRLTTRHHTVGESS